MAARKNVPSSTSPQAKLAAVIKSARDFMRKDAGLNGDLDRIPQLAWLLFLKAFDGLEESREITDEKFRPAIDAPYRWRDWAADPNGRTGEALLTFVPPIATSHGCPASTREMTSATRARSAARPMKRSSGVGRSCTRAPRSCL